MSPPSLVSSLLLLLELPPPRPAKDARAKADANSVGSTRLLLLLLLEPSIVVLASPLAALFAEGALRLGAAVVSSLSVFCFLGGVV